MPAPPLHPAVLAHMQSMQDDLAEMTQDLDSTDPYEALEVALLLLDLYERILEQQGLFVIERADQVH